MSTLEDRLKSLRARHGIKYEEQLDLDPKFRSAHHGDGESELLEQANDERSVKGGHSPSTLNSKTQFESFLAEAEKEGNDQTRDATLERTAEAIDKESRAWSRQSESDLQALQEHLNATTNKGSVSSLDRVLFPARQPCVEANDVEESLAKTSVSRPMNTYATASSQSPSISADCKRADEEDKMENLRVRMTKLRQSDPATCEMFQTSKVSEPQLNLPDVPTTAMLHPIEENWKARHGVQGRDLSSFEALVRLDARSLHDPQSKGSSSLYTPSKSDTRISEPDSDIDSWCCICNEDGSLVCVGCDKDVYCEPCWAEGHSSMGTDDLREHKRKSLAHATDKGVSNTAH